MERVRQGEREWERERGALERNASAGTLFLQAMERKRESGGERERQREREGEREREEPPRGDKVSQHQCQV